MSQNTIPIIVIVRDRLIMLKQCIRSLMKQNIPISIILVDNASTYPPLQKFLSTAIKRFPKIKYIWKYRRNAMYDNLQHAQQRLLRLPEFRNSSVYGITDHDVVLVNPRAVQTYKQLLDKMNTRIDGIGPQLRINNIPTYYPLRKLVLKKHHKFWTRNGILNHTNPHCRYRVAPIDTTFALYRRSYIKVKGATDNCLRVYKPYDALHLDWYLNPTKLNEEQKYYTEHSGSVSHWGGTWFRNVVTNNNSITFSK